MNLTLILLFSTMSVWSTILSQETSWTWFPDPARGQRLQKRWQRFKDIPANERTPERVRGVCGAVIKETCSVLAGRPPDNEQLSCDIQCCYQGHLTGSCKSKVSVKYSVEKLIASLVSQTLIPPNVSIDPSCECSDDWRNASCGPDGSFRGIRCPFDRSACARKCCREGRSGGRCGGFLRTKCKCS